jgi:MinD-like ATPase involved in chromosome partitioning or flagellar assembly
MLTTLWSTKGGSGTSVVAATLALVRGDDRHRAILVDLDGAAGDLLDADCSGPGVADWLNAAGDPPSDVIERLAVPVTSSVSVIPRGDGPLAEPSRARLLSQLLARYDGAVIVDCGTVLAPRAGVASACYEQSTHALLVVRPCYLALRRVQRHDWTASKLVVVREPGRALSKRDIEAATGVDVVAEVPFDASIARAVDAGLLASKPPKLLVRALRRVAT